MRTDMDKLICERQRLGSRERSHKTGMRINPNVDLENFDSGPERLPMGRGRQEHGGIYRKRLNENLNPLRRYLEASIGRLWDDVYSEIRSGIDPRQAIGYHVLQHLEHMVDMQVRMENGIAFLQTYGWVREVRGLYVHPDTGILCYQKLPRQKWSGQPEEKKSLHWYGNTYFRLETLKKSICGCRDRKIPVEPKKHWYSPKPEAPDVCWHNNPLIERKIWYVVEYRYHQPDDVFMIIRYELASDYERRKYSLTEPGSRHILYYRDRPDKMKDPIVFRRKVAGKKELKLIREMLGGASSAPLG